MSTPDTTQATPVATPATAPANIYDAIQAAQVLSEIATLNYRPQNVEGHHFVVLSDHFKTHDITNLVEKAQPTPRRKTGRVELQDLESLLTYCAEMAAAKTALVYCNRNDSTITAVFNDHRAAEAGWRDHRAQYKAEFTPEFKRWIDNNKKTMDQTAFAEFIEDNFVDIPGAAAQVMLDVATTIQATTGISFSSAKRLQNGQSQLVYNETIDARAGASGALEIPKEFALGLRIYKNGAGYKLNARLKYRLNSGQVKFWYELDRPEVSIDDAFSDYITTMRDKSGYQVLLGVA